MVDYYSNGTMDLLLDHMKSSVAGSPVMFGVLILAIIFVFFLVARMNPKYALLFSIPAIIGIFGYATEESIMGSQYAWVVAMVALVVAFILYLIFSNINQ